MEYKNKFSAAMGPKEMKYRYQCLVEKIHEEVEVLSDLLREQVSRMDDKFDMVHEKLL